MIGEIDMVEKYLKQSGQLNSINWLIASSQKLYCNDCNGGAIQSSVEFKYYLLDAQGAWSYYGSASSDFAGAKTFVKANTPVYTDTSYTTIHFDKTDNQTITTTLPLLSAGIASAGPDIDPKKVILSLNLAGEYQKWSGYPDSPVKTSDYPYQVLYGSIEVGLYLVISPNSFYAYPLRSDANATRYMYDTENKTWALNDTINAGNIILNAGGSTLIQRNNPVYTDDTLTVVNFAKTTPATSPAITSGQTIKTSYTKGTVKSAEGIDLASYVDAVVTNKAP